MTVRIWGVLGLVLLMAGCGGADVSELETRLDTLRDTPKGHVAALPEMPIYDVTPYDPNGRSPFARESAATVPDSGSKPNLARDTQRPREPLEAYALESLRYAGALVSRAGVTALVETPDGQMARVKVGEYLGKHEGQVVSISMRVLTVREFRTDEQGRSVPMMRSLSIDAPDSNAP
ncbi:pilus assembly protein PilP [Larsenimonas salina]|uniref:pilus assembly protein PilP n=1 Tax=Larsenimonas salina TaxID=1295565 RepID=UPI00207484EA|nr:pilus assembly protein PilP [Larsenimonas salina]MCM5704161.1 pilus assembly protein PilP [Larsenimonas salina]